MIGEQSVAALDAQVTRLERWAATTEDPGTVLAEARTAIADMRNELERDLIESRDAWLTQPGSLSLVETLQHQTPFNEEVAGDRAAIARLGATLRSLNQRVDRASYATIEERIKALTGSGLPKENATVLAGSHDTAGVGKLYGTYLQGQFVKQLQAVTLTAGTWGTRADPADVLDDFRTLRRSKDMTDQTAALLATTRNPDAAYARFESLRDSDLTPEVAAILAEPSESSVRRVFDALLVAGDIDGASAATVAAAAARGGVAAPQAVRTYATIREESDRKNAGVLAAAAVASRKSADQLLAARAYFAKNRGIDADAAAAAWALDGVAGPAMASIINLLFQSK